MGFFLASFLLVGHVLGLLAAKVSMDIFDYHPTCIFENEFDYVNGDWSEFLTVFSWAGLIAACMLYASLIVCGMGKSNVWKGQFWCFLCIYILIYIAWFTIALYILMFFSYIYMDETRLVHSCGGFEEVREIWFMTFGALFMVIPASCCACCYCFFALKAK